MGEGEGEQSQGATESEAPSNADSTKTEETIIPLSADWWAHHHDPNSLPKPAEEAPVEEPTPPPPPAEQETSGNNEEGEEAATETKVPSSEEQDVGGRGTYPVKIVQQRMISLILTHHHFIFVACKELRLRMGRILGIQVDSDWQVVRNIPSVETAEKQRF